MKKIILLLAVFICLSFSEEPRKYPIWHQKPDGNYVILHLTQQAALMHLANHEGDWCHGRACPWDE